MFQIILFIALGGVIGTAGSIVLVTFVKNLPMEIFLAAASFLGAFCSSIFICREHSIQEKIGKDHDAQKRALLKVWPALFWLIFIGGLATAVYIGLKTYDLL